MVKRLHEELPSLALLAGGSHAQKGMTTVIVSGRGEVDVAGGERVQLAPTMREMFVRLSR